MCSTRKYARARVFANKLRGVFLVCEVFWFGAGPLDGPHQGVVEVDYLRSQHVGNVRGRFLAILAVQEAATMSPYRQCKRRKQPLRKCVGHEAGRVWSTIACERVEP